MFLQSLGLLPDNVVVLTTSRNKAEERIVEKLNVDDKEHLAVLSVDETELNLEAVKEIYKGFFSEINTSDKRTDIIIEEIAVRNYI
jgi:hypothetical protein